MSDSPKLGNRIPFEDIQDISSWSIPSVGNQKNVVPSAQREAQKAQGFKIKNKGSVPLKKAEQSSVEEVDVEVKPITAEQLQQITDTAEREGREQGYTEGYKKGFSEGEKKGLKLGEKKAYQETKNELMEQASRLKLIADELLMPLDLQNSALENLVVEMATHFAKHLINKELSEDPRSLFALVEKAVSSLPAGANNIRVYLCQDDIELVHEAFENSGRNWQFFVDGKLSRGGCRVESDQSLVDYSIEKRMQTLLDEASLNSELSDEDLSEPDDYGPEGYSESKASNKLETVESTHNKGIEGKDDEAKDAEESKPTANKTTPEVDEDSYAGELATSSDDAEQNSNLTQSAHTHSEDDGEQP